MTRRTVNFTVSFPTAREVFLRETLQSIIAILGTGRCRRNRCESCEWERAEAVREAQDALTRLGEDTW
jgi:hypothetical protein